MKKKYYLLAFGMLLLVGCTKNTDMYDPSLVEQRATEHANDVFGVTFDANHTWSTTTTGEVTINAGSDISRVQVLVSIAETDEDGEVYSSMKVLNEAETNGQASIKLCYDAPANNQGLYVAFISEKGYSVQKVSGSTVSYKKANRSNRRALSQQYVYPDESTLVIDNIVESYANTRGWINDEMLYQMADYQSKKMDAVDYDSEFKEVFNKMVFSYFVNKAKNLPLVKSSGLYNEKVYPFTTGKEPIIVSPVYKRDGSPNYGYEIYNSELYYYYFKDEDLANQADPIAYLKSLPKYKAIQFSDSYALTDENVTGKHGAYALVFWGDETPQKGTQGSLIFPKGYKIGFMVRSNTHKDGKNSTQEIGEKKQGELYGDGRLNDKINLFGNFKSSGLGANDPRAAWLTLNDRLLLCWESGCDADFNDIILDVEGGVEGIIVPPEPEENIYTYCYEDTEVGDYDLNDVVIKAKRISNTKVEYSLIACGASDELYIKNIVSNSVINDQKEVHSLFGVTGRPFINTVKGAQVYSPVVVTVTVPSSFSLADPNTAPIVFNKTRNKTIELAKVGQNPHGLMIPYDFKYPLELVCIKNAYLKFNDWGQNAITSTDWYKSPVKSNIYE